jgi:hypothetical protein
MSPNPSGLCEHFHEKKEGIDLAVSARFALVLFTVARF